MSAATHHPQHPPSIRTVHSLPHRLAVFTYGVLSYGIGVTALVGLILAMLGVIELGSGPVRDLGLPAALAWNAALILSFAVQHTIMARPGFKSWWTRIVPAAAERSTFVLATGLIMLSTLWLWQPMPEVIWSVSHPLLVKACYGLALAGWTYLFVASFAIDHFELFGLLQVFRHLRGRSQSPVPFKERWMYRFDRHPIMTGVLVGMWATPTMRMDHLLFALGFTAYVVVGVSFEERSLRQHLGSIYDDYAARVRTIVPRLRFADPRLESESLVDEVQAL